MSSCRATRGSSFSPKRGRPRCLRERPQGGRAGRPRGVRGASAGTARRPYGGLERALRCRSPAGLEQGASVGAAEGSDGPLCAPPGRVLICS